VSDRKSQGAAANAERFHRLFFALWPDAALREALIPRIRALQPAGVGRPQRPDQWHVTLEFLGSVPAVRLEAARDAAASVEAEPFEIAFDAVEYWRRPQVLCLAARDLPAALEGMVRDLRAGLAVHGFEPERRPFRPHLTLARKVSRPVELPAFEPLHWPAAEFALVESVTDRSGSYYAPLDAWPLAR
jgi:2'-5' RNA ligase